MLSNLVLKDDDNLVNLTTKVSLPLDSSIQLLSENFFLKGQERAALEHSLFAPKPTGISISLIPTWECNLRCSHCFVIHELVKRDPGAVDADGLADFIRRMKDEYPTVRDAQIHFVGGEPTLRANQNSHIMKRLKEAVPDVAFNFTATTNGYDCGEPEIDFLTALDRVVVSVDGPKSWHDKQRKALDDGECSPFESSLSTIRTLISKGMRDRLVVQASLPEEAMNLENLVELYTVLLMSGVKYESILPGFISPNKVKAEPEKSFVQVNSRSAYVKPCCKYRFMSNFVVDSSNRVFCDYFDADRDNLLGFLSDPVNKIAQAHERIIRASMPILNDMKCLSCPVVGLCWGWCANTKCIKPSDHCDPDFLLHRASENAKAGNLRSFLKNTKRNDITNVNSPSPKESCTNS